MLDCLGVTFFAERCPFKTYIKYRKGNQSIASQINSRFAALYLRSLLLSFSVIFCAPLQCYGSRSAWISIILGNRIRVWKINAESGSAKFRNFKGSKWSHGGPWSIRGSLLCWSSIRIRINVKSLIESGSGSALKVKEWSGIRICNAASLSVGWSCSSVAKVSVLKSESPTPTDISLGEEDNSSLQNSLPHDNYR